MLIGILVSVAVLSIGDGGQTERMGEEARRIAALIRLASEEAVLQNQEMALQVKKDGYTFEALGEQNWQPVEGDHMFRSRQLAEGLKLTLQIDDIDVPLVNTGEDKEGEPQSQAPARIYLLSSGEVTPFELILGSSEHQNYFKLSGQGSSEILMEGPLSER